MIRIKICCIKSIEEAETAVSFGASAIGLVGKMPSGPGPIDDELIKAIARSIPPPVATFLLTSETDPEKIVEHHKRTLTNTIQIVDKIKEGAYKYLREKIPAVKLVQAVHVIDEKSVDDALRISSFADAILLDSGNPDLAVKELGGTGRVHNWSLSRKIVEQACVPVFLAGGLNPSNVREAVERVNPFGVDICTGVRTNGELDKTKLKEFFNALK